jgi:hypothetical protein
MAAGAGGWGRMGIGTDLKGPYRGHPIDQGQGAAASRPPPPPPLPPWMH